jgi:hypothetical protein
LALQRAVGALGYESEIIWYQFGDKGSAMKKLLLGDAFTYRKRMKDRQELIDRDAKTKRGFETRNAAFQAFTDRYYTLSAPCKHLREAGALARRYEMVVCGSDQIWLPSHVIMDYYTLNFVPDGVGRIAYAPSFGVENLPRWMLPDYRAFLSRMDMVTAREDQGVELIRHITGKACPLVIDPTLLLDEVQWGGLLPKGNLYPDRPYVFMYFLGANERHRAAAKKYASRNHYALVTIPNVSVVNPADGAYADIQRYDVSPLQFLQLIRGAACVFTDSFHGCVFSILFGREFFAFERFMNGDASSTNSRIYSLLRTTGLENRLIRSGENPPAGAPIPYASVHANLSKAREASFNILSEALARRGGL